MQRREVLRLLAAGAFLPAVTPDVLAFFQEAQPAPGYNLRSLNSHQNAAVIRMIDLIIPATDTPGAKAARVNEFIDVILTDWATQKERASFLEGLGQVDQRSQALFKSDFVDAVASQQVEILQGLDQEFAVARETASPDSAAQEAAQEGPSKNFFGFLKQLTLYGYYTSEIGFRIELKQEIIPGAFHGCIPLPEVGKS